MTTYIFNAGEPNGNQALNHGSFSFIHFLFSFTGWWFLLSVFALCVLLRKSQSPPGFLNPLKTLKMDSGRLVKRNSLTSTRLGFGSQNRHVPRSPEHILASELSQILSNFSEQGKRYKVLVWGEKEMGMLEDKKHKMWEGETGLKRERRQKGSEEKEWKNKRRRNWWSYDWKQASPLLGSAAFLCFMSLWTDYHCLTGQKRQWRCRLGLNELATGIVFFTILECFTQEL